jgi:hypothetical protein
MGTHGVEEIRPPFCGADGDELPFVGHLQRVEAPQLMGDGHLGTHREGGLPDPYPHARKIRKLV